MKALQIYLATPSSSSPSVIFLLVHALYGSDLVDGCHWLMVLLFLLFILHFRARDVHWSFIGGQVCGIDDCLAAGYTNPAPIRCLQARNRNLLSILCCQRRNLANSEGRRAPHELSSIRALIHTLWKYQVNFDQCIHKSRVSILPCHRK